MVTFVLCWVCRNLACLFFWSLSLLGTKEWRKAVRRRKDDEHLRCFIELPSCRWAATVLSVIVAPYVKTMFRLESIKLYNIVIAASALVEGLRAIEFGLKAERQSDANTSQVN
jgi:hypothetical protein